MNHPLAALTDQFLKERRFLKNVRCLEYRVSARICDLIAALRAKFHSDAAKRESPFTDCLILAALQREHHRLTIRRVIG